MLRSWSRFSIILLVGSRFLPPTVAVSQDSLRVVRGVVLDDSTEVPIYDALVTIYAMAADASQPTRTDANGRFNFHVSPGEYWFIVRRVGYAPTETVTLTVTATDDVNLTITVPQNPIQLDPVVVTGDSTPDVRGPLVGFYARVERGMGTYITREEIELRQPTYITDILYGMPRVRVRSMRGAINKKIVRVGGADCPPVVWLDGGRVRVEDGSLDELIGAYDLEGVEVYGVSEIPFEFQQGDTRCGVVVMWTTRG